MSPKYRLCAKCAREKERILGKDEKLKSKMDQVSFSASQFSGITTPKLGMLAPGNHIFGRSVVFLFPEGIVHVSKYKFRNSHISM